MPALQRPLLRGLGNGYWITNSRLGLIPQAFIRQGLLLPSCWNAAVSGC